MATDAQIKANRLNALRSTGPLTAEGKSISSRNATLHGLSAKNVLIAGENPADFEALRQRLHVEFNPLTTIENFLVDKLSSDLWRLARVPVFEAALYEWTVHQHAEADADPLADVFGSRVSTLSNDEGADPRRNATGRTIEALIARNDLLSKLSRYEAHLGKQIKETLEKLSRLKD